MENLTQTTIKNILNANAEKRQEYKNYYITRIKELKNDVENRKYPNEELKIDDMETIEYFSEAIEFIKGLEGEKTTYPIEEIFEDIVVTYLNNYITLQQAKENINRIENNLKNEITKLGARYEQFLEEKEYIKGDREKCYSIGKN